MKSVPTYLTRYYVKGEIPFLSLNDIGMEEANEIKKAHCERNMIGGFYAADDYLVHRRNIEEWMYRRLLEKGGHPTNRVPVYMTLGESPKGEYDIRSDIQRNAAELRIPLQYLDLSAITFTFPDSMYRFVLDEEGNIIGGERTNTPDVYLYGELEDVISVYKTDEHYIEAQVWNRDMLSHFLRECRKE
ncbi:MAG TPA: hypothetical protein VN540_04240 [Clostridia bacterium]|nr:hypothetical protein [Clostridia bacterium]